MLFVLSSAKVTSIGHWFPVAFACDFMEGFNLWNSSAVNGSVLNLKSLTERPYVTLLAPVKGEYWLGFSPKIKCLPTEIM